MPGARGDLIGSAPVPRGYNLAESGSSEYPVPTSLPVIFDDARRDRDVPEPGVRTTPATPHQPYGGWRGVFYAAVTP